MKNRFLYVICAFLALFSSYAGVNVQKAVFSSSDELKIVTSHEVVPEFISASVNEARLTGRTEYSVLRFQKKNVTSFYIPFDFALFPAKTSPFKFSFLKDISESTSRVLLLPKSVENIIFLQTVI